MTQKGSKFKYVWIAVIIIAVAVIIVFLNLRSNKLQNEKKSFFFQMDGYIALPVATNYTLPFTYCYGQGDDFIEPNTIAEVRLKGQENVSSSLLSTEKNEEEQDGYQSCIYNIQFSFPEMGLYQVSTLEIVDTSGNSIEWPIGDWTFDIGPIPSEEYDTIFSSVALTTLTSEYSYAFTLPEGAIIKQIWYGPDQSIISPTALEASGKIDFEHSDFRVKVIRPKLKLDIGGDLIWAYGSISYCGILGQTPGSQGDG